MRAKDSVIPADTRFLAGISAARLRKMHKTEKDPKAASRLLAFAMRKEGKSIRDIGKFFGKSYSTIRDWLLRAVQVGAVGRYDLVREGAPRKLDSRQMEQLYADLIAGSNSCGFESGVWTAPLIAMHVKNRFGTDYAPSSIYGILHNLGFSCRKPRPKHPKSATKSSKNAYKKKAIEIIDKYPEYLVISIDSASFIIGWNTQNGWYLVGEPVTTPVSLSRARFHTFGALYKGGFDYEFYEKIDSSAVVEMLDRLHRKFGKIIVVLDNAAYHKSAEVKKFVESCGKDIILLYLPPYTPELNPIEGQWRLLRKATANRLYKSTGAMKRSIASMVKRGEVKVAKMSAYLS